MKAVFLVVQCLLVTFATAEIFHVSLRLGFPDILQIAAGDLKSDLEKIELPPTCQDTGREKVPIGHITYDRFRMYVFCTESGDRYIETGIKLREGDEDPRKITFETRTRLVLTQGGDFSYIDENQEKIPIESDDQEIFLSEEMNRYFRFGNREENAIQKYSAVVYNERPVWKLKNILSSIAEFYRSLPETEEVFKLKWNGEIITARLDNVKREFELGQHKISIPRRVKMERCNLTFKIGRRDEFLCDGEVLRTWGLQQYIKHETEDKATDTIKHKTEDEATDTIDINSVAEFPLGLFDEHFRNMRREIYPNGCEPRQVTTYVEAASTRITTVESTDKKCGEKNTCMIKVTGYISSAGTVPTDPYEVYFNGTEYLSEDCKTVNVTDLVVSGCGPLNEEELDDLTVQYTDLKGLAKYLDRAATNCATSPQCRRSGPPDYVHTFPFYYYGQTHDDMIFKYHCGESAILLKNVDVMYKREGEFEIRRYKTIIYSGRLDENTFIVSEEGSMDGAIGVHFPKTDPTLYGYDHYVFGLYLPIQKKRKVDLYTGNRIACNY